MAGLCIFCIAIYFADCTNTTFCMQFTSKYVRAENNVQAVVSN